MRTVEPGQTNYGMVAAVAGLAAWAALANVGFWAAISGFEPLSAALVIPARGVALFAFASFLVGSAAGRLRRNRASRARG